MPAARFSWDFLNSCVAHIYATIIALAAPGFSSAIKRILHPPAIPLLLLAEAYKFKAPIISRYLNLMWPFNLPFLYVAAALTNPRQICPQQISRYGFTCQLRIHSIRISVPLHSVPKALFALLMNLLAGSVGSQ